MTARGYLESATGRRNGPPGGLARAAQANTVRKPFSICGGTEQCLLVETTVVLKYSAGFTIPSAILRAGWGFKREGES
jgi:hypothetical protein